MHDRRLLLLSLGLNVALAAGLFHAVRMRTSAVLSTSNVVATNGAPRDRVIPVIRKQFFAWNELESTNYDIYVANLRDIACPEETIHDIILADVNKLYDQRKVAEEQSPEHFKTLDDERNALLTRLLGTDWNVSEKKAGFAFSKVAFSDPLLNELSADVRAKVEEILSRWSQQAVTDKQAAAVLEQKMRFELAGILSPPQLEELLSRYSANAVNLNNQLAELQFFKATTNEFRNLFRATDALDLQIRLLGDTADFATQQELKTLQQQRELAIKNVLGAKRYAEYTRLKDPDYRAGLAQAGGNPRAAKTLQEINQATVVEQAVAQANPELTDVQKQIELKRIELEQLQAQAVAQGHQLPPEPPMPPMPLKLIIQPYTISSDENINTLAQKYQITVRQIQAANPGINIDSIKPGETVNIPTFVPTQPTQ